MDAFDRLAEEPPGAWFLSRVWTVSDRQSGQHSHDPAFGPNPWTRAQSRRPMFVRTVRSCNGSDSHDPTRDMAEWGR